MPKVPKARGASRAPSQAPLVDIFREPPLSDFPSFRQYNEAFELWMADLYHPSLPPIVDQPDANDPYYLSDSYLTGTDHIMSLASHYRVELEDLWFYGNADDVVFDHWLRLSVQKREARLLSVLEDLHRRNQAAPLSACRDRAPEITVERFSRDPAAFGTLLQHLIIGPNRMKPLWDPDVGDDFGRMPLVRNEAFERKYRIFAFEPPTPLSRAVRAVADRAIAQRQSYLALFTHSLVSLITHCPTRQIVIEPYRVPLSRQKRKVRRAAGFPRKTDDPTAPIVAEGDSCEKCGHSASASVKLLACSRCKNANRLVWYCSSTCQKDDYRKHSSICGKPWEHTSGTKPPPRPEMDMSDKRYCMFIMLCANPSVLWALPSSTSSTPIYLPDTVPMIMRPLVFCALKRLIMQAVVDSDPAAIGAVLLFLDGSLPNVGQGAVEYLDNHYQHQLHTAEIFDIATPEEALEYRDRAIKKVGECHGANDLDPWHGFYFFFQSFKPVIDVAAHLNSFIEYDRRRPSTNPSPPPPCPCCDCEQPLLLAFDDIPKLASDFRRAAWELWPWKSGEFVLDEDGEEEEEHAGEEGTSKKSRKKRNRKKKKKKAGGKAATEGQGEGEVGVEELADAVEELGVRTSERNEGVASSPLRTPFSPSFSSLPRFPGCVEPAACVSPFSRT